MFTTEDAKKIRDEFAVSPCNDLVLFAMTRAVELAAARGPSGLDIGPLKTKIERESKKHWSNQEMYTGGEMLTLIEEIEALGARNAVLEAEREDYRNKMELAQECEAERDRAMHEAQDEVEKLRERLSASEEGNRELVRQAQQIDQLGAEVERLKARCAALSAARQVLSAHVDRTERSCTHPPGMDFCAWCGTRRYPCSPTCTHDDAATPGHLDRVKERSAVMRKSALLDYAKQKDEWRPADADAYDAGAEAMRAACWESVQRELEKAGLTGHRRAFKAAIEGAVP